MLLINSNKKKILEYFLCFFAFNYGIDVFITLKTTMLSQSNLLTGLFEMSPELEMGVALYTRRVLIKSRADNILPKWLRFVKGTVDFILVWIIFFLMLTPKVFYCNNLGTKRCKLRE